MRNFRRHPHERANANGRPWSDRAPQRSITVDPPPLPAQFARDSETARFHRRAGRARRARTLDTAQCAHYTTAYGSTLVPARTDALTAACGPSTAPAPTTTR